MARKVNSTHNKTRPKNKSRKDYTRQTALKLRSFEALSKAEQQEAEILASWFKDQAAILKRKVEKEEARVAKYGAQR